MIKNSKRKESSPEFDEDFIDILNGFESASNSGKLVYTPDDIFLDETGAPTDRFLEALKVERDIVSSSQRNRGSGVGKSYYDSSDDNDDKYDNDDDDDDDDKYNRRGSTRNNDTIDGIGEKAKNDYRNDNGGYLDDSSTIANSDCDLSDTSDIEVSKKSKDLTSNRLATAAVNTSSRGVNRSNYSNCKKHTGSSNSKSDIAKKQTAKQEGEIYDGNGENKKLQVNNRNNWSKTMDRHYTLDNYDSEFDLYSEQDKFAEENNVKEVKINSIGDHKMKQSSLTSKDVNKIDQPPRSDSQSNELAKVFQEKKLQFEELSRKVLNFPIASNHESSEDKPDNVSALELQNQLLSVVNELKGIIESKQSATKNSFMKPTQSSNSKHGVPASGNSSNSIGSNKPSKTNVTFDEKLESNINKAAEKSNVNTLALNSNSAINDNNNNHISSSHTSNSISVNVNGNSNCNGVGIPPSESKLKSLNLRLHGQMNTINILELQIQEFNQVLQEKEKIIAHLQSQVVKSAHPPKARASSPGYRTRYPSAGDKTKTQTSAQIAAENLEKVKAQMKEIEGRHSADIVRYKLLKEYAEKAKSRVNELETKVVEITEENTDLKDKLAKYKKELKDRVNEYVASQENNMEHLKTIQNMKTYVSETEEEVSQLRVENNKMKTEIQNLKMEVKLNIENSKNSKMEIEILKERLDNRKTESKLFSLISGNSSVLNPTSVYESSSSGNNNNRQKINSHQSNVDNYSMKIVQRSKLMTFNNLATSSNIEKTDSDKVRKPPGVKDSPTGFVETAMRNRRYKNDLNLSTGNRSRSFSPSARVRKTSNNHSDDDNSYNNGFSSGNEATNSNSISSKIVRYSLDNFEPHKSGLDVKYSSNNSNRFDSNASKSSSINNKDDSYNGDSDSSNKINRNGSKSAANPTQVEDNQIKRNEELSAKNSNDTSEVGQLYPSTSNDVRARDVASGSNFDTITSSAIKSKYEKLKKMYEKVNQK